MTKPLPAWALQAATPDDHGTAEEAHRQGRLEITWPDQRALRAWATQQRWPTPLFDFEQAFTAHMLASTANFALAVADSGVELYLPGGATRSQAISSVRLTRSTRAAHPAGARPAGTRSSRSSASCAAPSRRASR
jgi:hypothetical protein